MAIIIRCRNCKARLLNDHDPCSVCGSESRMFILDYMFDGRHSKRIRQELPEGIHFYEEAIAVERVRRQIKKKKIKTITPDGAAVKNYFPEYLKWCKKHRSITTHDDIKRTYEAHLKRILGEEIIFDICEENYDYYQTVRMADIKRHSKGPVKNRTINKELNYFSGFLKWCRRYKKIKVEHFYYDALPAPKRKPDVLAIEEIVSIIRAAKKYPLYYALILALYSLGLRYSGVVKLKLCNFDFRFKSVHTVQKGDKDIILPVDDMLIEAVKALGETDPDIYLFRDKRKKITPDNPSGKPIKNTRITLKKICDEAKITKKVTPHAFRHAWATHLMGAGVNLRIIQQFLDHEEVTTTEKYTHVVIDNLRMASSVVMAKVRQQLISQQKEQ